MKKQHFVALGLVIFILIWMFIPRGGRTQDDRYDTGNSENPQITAIAESSNQAPATGTGDFTVRAARLSAETYTRTVNVRGRTQADRLVTVRAETAGQIVATPVARGERANKGDILCELAVDNRDTDLQEAISRREQARLEYEGALDLQSRSLQSEAAVAQLKASYDSAIAAVARAELALERTRIRAPFSGIMESRDVEVGDYMELGGQCATLMDDQPMLLVGLVPEQDVGSLSVGTRVQGELITGERVSGRLRYIARAADTTARSYRIEVELEPSETPIRQGVSADIRINANEMRAHLIPPSSITLDDEGLLGVKILNSDNVVEFHHIQTVGESTRLDRPGFWVTGLPDDIVLITLGQEIVFPGQTLQTNFDWSSR